VPWLLLFAFLILVVYPLSIGPALKLAITGILPPQTLEIYRPLMMVTRRTLWASDFIGWYITKVWKVEIAVQT
jgi:hypothetical protein